MTSPEVRAAARATIMEVMHRNAAAQAEEDAQVEAGVIVRGARAISEVAGITVGTVYKYHKRGSFPVRRSGSSLIARRRSLENWAARRASAQK